MKLDREKIMICVLLAGCVVCVAAFRLAFPAKDVKFARAAGAEKFGYKIPANSATAAELKIFFGITARKAAATAKAREAEPFKSAGDLGRVEQLTEKDRARIAKYLTFEGEKP